MKDSKRFADSGGWGYAVFDYDTASDTFKPGTSASTPPQGNDAKCGFACHTQAKTRDYVFTYYGKGRAVLAGWDRSLFHGTYSSSEAQQRLKNQENAGGSHLVMARQRSRGVAPRGGTSAYIHCSPLTIGS